jgi:hypothetical protein
MMRKRKWNNNASQDTSEEGRVTSSTSSTDTASQDIVKEGGMKEGGMTSSTSSTTDTASQDIVKEGGMKEGGMTSSTSSEWEMPPTKKKKKKLKHKCNHRLCPTAGGNERLVKCACGDVSCTKRVSMSCFNKGHLAVGHTLYMPLQPGQFVTMLPKPFGLVFEETTVVAGGGFYRVVVGRDGVVKGGHAEANGNLKWGDIITEIDDEELLGESLQKVESVIEELGDSADLHRVVWHRDWRDFALYMTGMSLL